MDGEGLNGANAEVVQAAYEELQRLKQQHSTVMQRIRLLKRTLGGLAAMYGDQSVPDEVLKLIGRHIGPRVAGLTKLCRQVLVEATHPMTASEICAAMQQRIPQVLERHKHPLASVTTVLGRLVQSGNVQRIRTENGTQTWKWIGNDSISTNNAPNVSTSSANSQASIEAE